MPDKSQSYTGKPTALLPAAAGGVLAMLNQEVSLP